MPASSSSLQAARERLGAQLRELRQAAGLSGRDFAAAAGCQPAKVSQVEKGTRPASVADVRLWCRVCEAPAQRTEELLAEQAAVARLWISFRDLGRKTGLNATQKLLSGDMWERVQLYRGYQTKVIPGLLQTESYMTAVMTSVRRERGVEADDVAEAVAERIGRQGYLLQPGRQFVFVMEEPVLRFRPYGTDVQRDQLAHLLTMMRLPSSPASRHPDGRRPARPAPPGVVRHHRLLAGDRRDALRVPVPHPPGGDRRLRHRLGPATLDRSTRQGGAGLHPRTVWPPLTTRVTGDPLR